MIIRMKMDLPTEAALVPLIRRQAEALLTMLEVHDEDIYRAQVILTEACSNIIRHAYDEPNQKYRVEIDCHAERLVMRVSDYGKGFCFEEVAIPEPGQLGGYGIYFIRQTADAFDYQSLSGKETKLTAQVNLRYRSQTALDYARRLDLDAVEV